MYAFIARQKTVTTQQAMFLYDRVKTIYANPKAHNT